MHNPVDALAVVDALLETEDDSFDFQQFALDNARTTEPSSDPVLFYAVVHVTYMEPDGGIAEEDLTPAQINQLSRDAAGIELNVMIALREKGLRVQSMGHDTHGDLQLEIYVEPKSKGWQFIWDHYDWDVDNFGDSDMYSWRTSSGSMSALFDKTPPDVYTGVSDFGAQSLDVSAWFEDVDNLKHAFNDHGRMLKSKDE